MKNKRLLYVLLPAVLGVWGLIFQRIWLAARGDEAVAPAGVGESVAATTSGSGVVARIPGLLLSYPDPFRAGSSTTPLATFPAGPTGTASGERASYARPLAAAPLNLPVAPAATPVVPVVWPVVKYLGFINNPRLENRIALLTINDKEYSVKSGGNKEEVTVSKIWRDSVRVVFKGYKKTVIRVLSN